MLNFSSSFENDEQTWLCGAREASSGDYRWAEEDLGGGKGVAVEETVPGETLGQRRHATIRTGFTLVCMDEQFSARMQVYKLRSLLIRFSPVVD